MCQPARSRLPSIGPGTWRLGLIFLLSLKLAGPAAAESLTVGIFDYPPHLVIDAAGQPHGPVVDDLGRLFRIAGITPGYRLLSFKRMMLSLKDGDIDLAFGQSERPDLIDIAYRGARPFLMIQLNAYRQAGAPAYKRLEDLERKRLAIARGAFHPLVGDFVDNAKNQVEVLDVSDSMQGLQLVLQNRADFFIGHQAPAGKALADLPIPGRIVADPVTRVDIRFWIRFGHPRGSDLMRRLDRAAAQTAEPEP